MSDLLQLHSQKIRGPKETHPPRYEFRTAVAMKMQFMEYYACWFTYLPTFFGHHDAPKRRKLSIDTA
jgi:hypothetical protein